MVGWDIALDNKQAFVAALQECVDMNPEVLGVFSARARAYASAHRNDPAPIEQHRRLFQSALTLRMIHRGVGGPEAA